MGQSHSISWRSSESESESESGSRISHRSRFRQKLRRIYRRRSNSSKHSSHGFKLVSADNFAGIALLTLISAEMTFKDKWLVCVSLGMQTFRTDISDNTDKPVWNSEKKLLLESNGPHVARVSVYETNLLKKSNLIGYCDIDLLQFLTQDSDSEMISLLDPSSPGIIVGKLSFSCFVEDPEETEKSFARRLLSIVIEDLLYQKELYLPLKGKTESMKQDEWVALDRHALGVVRLTLAKNVAYNVMTQTTTTGLLTTLANMYEKPSAINKDYDEDGHLSYSEFSDLIDAFGNQVASDKKEELFKAADENGDGVVSMDELAALLALQQHREPLINSCPVCGEMLQASDMFGSMIHMTLCFDEGTGNQVMSGGFLTDKQASYGWLFKLSEWANLSSYSIGLNSGSNAGHILVFDRRSMRLVEEVIDRKIILSMRAIYQSKAGLQLMDKGAKEILQELSEKQGKKMDSFSSAKEIPKFIDFFKDQLNISEMKYPLDHYKTFNEFFIRELKPGVRPIACMDRDDVAVCAADCRLMAFATVEESTRFWIKGRKFSVQGLLGNDVSSSPFINGTLVIFRLAPQDYHRFHLPVSGTVERFVHIPGALYTVNPIAVNSKYCNVFTENKRVVSIISTAHFGKVAFVAIGATMVGSITFTRKEGDYVKKGDEFGYFSFGGSTVICVFEKDTIKIDQDLLDNSAKSLETLVRVGMKLGVSTKFGYQKG